MALAGTACAGRSPPVTHSALVPAPARSTGRPKKLQLFLSAIGFMYTPCVRADTSYAISRLARALTIPTEELSQLADQVMLYMAQTAADRVTFDGNATDADQLHAMSDSDWSVGHSTTGWPIFLAGAAVAYASKRQRCIAMSSGRPLKTAASLPRTPPSPRTLFPNQFLSEVGFTLL